MDDKCQVDDYHRYADISTITSETLHSFHLTSIKSDLSSETGLDFSKRRKDYVVKRTKFNHDKTESLSSDESADKSSSKTLNENSATKLRFRKDSCGDFRTVLSYESMNVRESESSYRTAKWETFAARNCDVHQSKIDLNEALQIDRADCFQQFRHRPVAVVARVGVPVGLPKKPLQFDGELGWKRSGTNSAFRDTSCSRRSLFSQGIDLNVAPTMDMDLPTDESSSDVSLKQQPKPFFLNLDCQSANYVNRHKPEATTFESNSSHVIENTCKAPISEGRRSSYWIDSNSMRGFGHVPMQPLLVAAPTAEQVRMVVPLQSDYSIFPHAPSGIYIGRINGLSPTFYPPSFVSHFNSHLGAAVVPQISGPVLAAYPGTLNVLESSHGLNPNAFANIRPTFIQNGSITLLDNGSRGGRNIERVKPVEQLAFSTKRREPDGGWNSSQISYRRMAP